MKILPSFCNTKAVITSTLKSGNAILRSLVVSTVRKKFTTSATVCMPTFANLMRSLLGSMLRNFARCRCYVQSRETASPEVGSTREGTFDRESSVERKKKHTHTHTYQNIVRAVALTSRLRSRVFNSRIYGHVETTNGGMNLRSYAIR